MHIQINELNGDQMITILNPVTKESATINASIGGTLISLKLKATEKVHEIITIPYQQTYSLGENPFYPSGLLTPWVNRVRNGNYSFLGKNYQLPINEKNLSNAIHGFMAREKFSIVQQTKNEEMASITLCAQAQGTFEGYPFPFEAYLTYSLQVNGLFTFTMACKNTGNTPLPFAIGWHPYFQLGNNLDDLTLYFNSIEKYLSDSQMIPLKAESFNAEKGMKLMNEKPDHVFLLQKSKSNSVALQNTKSNLQLALSFSSEEFPYFVAFCPENESCIALEPMTGNTDCFNTFEGLLELAPNQSFAGEIKITLSKIGQN